MATRLLQPCIFILFTTLTTQVFADYRDDVGYNQLAAEIVGPLPDGSGVVVTHVEAAISDAWMPNTGDAKFAGKTIIDQSFPASAGFSSHASNVGKLFYGNSSSMASGIDTIDVFSAVIPPNDGSNVDWIFNFLNTDGSQAPLISGSRVTNHSWIGGGLPVSEADKAGISNALRRTDWLVETDEAIQVVGMGNGTSNQPLLGSAYNVIAVGRTDGNHGQGSIALDADYTNGRTRPDIVAPLGTTSSATPVVSASAAMLVEQAHQAGITAGSASTNNRNGDVIYNGERSEVVKAIIMAGADRVTDNNNSAAQITDYRSAVANQADNGLDKRFGTGQLNVYNNHQIMAAGEQDSLQDGGGTTVELLGYDYDASFGGNAGSNDIASYLFSTDTLTGSLQLTASLVWNIQIEDSPEIGFDPQATLHDLDLMLFDVTDGVGNETLLLSSTSDIENTENLWTYILAGRDYELQMVAADGQAFNWDYGIAWQVTAVSIPGAFWLFMSGLLGLSVMRRRIITLN